VQGVVKSYDPTSGGGTVIHDVSLGEFEIAPGALKGSSFRMLRQGQRVVWDLDGNGFAARIRLGSEEDMGTPGFEVAHPDDVQHPQDGPDMVAIPEPVEKFSFGSPTSD
jgi:cold shock CspA family protein